jgi:hypothetical protein
VVADAGTLNAAPIAETKPLSAEPIAGTDGPQDPEALPSPSTVNGAAPLGAPATVSWAAAGVADTTAQTAAIDRNTKTERFIGSYPVLNRKRSKLRILMKTLQALRCFLKRSV